MTCNSCALSIRLALSRLPGIGKAEVSFPEKRARVTYDPNRVQPQRMVQAIKELGYNARVASPG